MNINISSVFSFDEIDDSPNRTMTMTMTMRRMRMRMIENRFLHLHYRNANDDLWKVADEFSCTYDFGW